MNKLLFLTAIACGWLDATTSFASAAAKGNKQANAQKNDERHENEAVQKAQKVVNAAEKIVREAEKSARQAADKIKDAALTETMRSKRDTFKTLYQKLKPLFTEEHHVQ